MNKNDEGTVKSVKLHVEILEPNDMMGFIVPFKLNGNESFMSKNCWERAVQLVRAEMGLKYFSDDGRMGMYGKTDELYCQEQKECSIVVRFRMSNLQLKVRMSY